MSAESPTQVHHLEDHKIVVGEHPNPDVDEAIQDMLETHTDQDNEFATFIAEVPNLNEKYKDVIDTAQSKLQADGMNVGTPIIVLDRENFARAVKIGNPDAKATHTAEYHRNHILLSEQPERKEILGEDRYADYLLGVALHEGAHATMGEFKKSITSAEQRVTDALGAESVQYTVHTFIHGGFQKYQDTRGVQPQILGGFWEEGFADQYRIKALEELGISWDFPNKDSYEKTTDDGTPIHYIGSNVHAPAIEEGTGIVSVPMKYSAASRETNATGLAVISAPSSLAGYGVELLDQRIPGLFDDMMNSRKDPEAYRDFVRKVESVQPGLYRELSKVNKSSAGYSQGLKVIVQALGSDDKELQA